MILNGQTGYFYCNNAEISGTVNANAGTFKNVKIESGTVGGFTIHDNYISAGDTVNMSLSVQDQGYPGIRWKSGNTTYAFVGMFTNSGYASGQIELSNNNNLDLLMLPGYMKFSGSSQILELSSEVYSLQSGQRKPAITISSTNMAYSVHVGIDNNNKANIYASSWPTRSSEVSVGQVWLDGTTLRVRTS